MSLIVPKIVYASSTLVFGYPPRNVPFKSYQAIRHDNYASSGVRESILERIEDFLEFQMEYVKLGSKIEDWDSFIRYALKGGEFNYHPDSTDDGTYIVYVLEDTTWLPNWQQLGAYTFALKFRKIQMYWNKACPSSSGVQVGTPVTLVLGDYVFGGSRPFAWNVESGGIDGLIIDPITGDYAGTPTTATTYDWNISATDADGDVINLECSTTVAEAP